MRVVVHRAGGLPHRIVPLPPGAHAIVNEPFGEEATGRARRAARLLETAAPDLALLADHGDQTDRGLCHHGETYGTVSATSVALDRNFRVLRYLHASGLPCRTAPLDRTADARAVVGAALP
jgi:hypothetical protein